MLLLFFYLSLFHVLLLGAAPSVEAFESWRPPVDGAVTRAFAITATDRFAPGQHRGADFAAAPGATVRAACTGRVVVAGRVGTSGRVVTIRCGAWRATHMPLVTITVHAGDSVHRGTMIGTLAPSSRHAGLHLGARREGDTFGYTDPLRFIRSGHRRFTPPAPIPRHVIRGAVPRRAPAPQHAPVQPPALARPPASVPPPALALLPALALPPAPAWHAAPGRAVSPDGERLAPWPVWAGLLLLLAGALGGGVRLRVRRRHAPAAGAIASEAR